MALAIKKILSNQKKYKKGWNHLFCLSSGISIAVIISLFASLGINFILTLINNLHLSKQLVVIYTSIFYGIVFFIARAGVRIKKNPRYRSFYREDPDEEPESISGIKSMLSRVGSVLWIAFGVISIVLLTPALVIYWKSPLNPDRIIMTCGFFFSLAGAVAFFFQNNEKIKSTSGRIIFFSGVFLGLLVFVFSV